MVNKQSGFSRREFLGAAAASVLVFSEACSRLTDDEIRAIPSTALDELAKNPEKFSNIDNIKTSGFVANTDKEVTHVSHYAPANKYSWHEYEGTWLRIVYLVSNQPDGQGVNLKAVSEKKLVDYDVDGMGSAIDKRTSTGENLLGREFPQPVASKRYEIIGRIVKMADKKTKREEYVLEIGKITPER
jgi:hypothetical protein